MDGWEFGTGRVYEEKLTGVGSSEGVVVGVEEYCESALFQV